MQVTSATVSGPTVPQTAEAKPGAGLVEALSPGQSSLIQSGAKSGRGDDSSLGGTHTELGKSFDAPSKLGAIKIIDQNIKLTAGLDEMIESPAVSIQSPILSPMITHESRGPVPDVATFGGTPSSKAEQGVLSVSDLELPKFQAVK